MKNQRMKWLKAIRQTQQLTLKNKAQVVTVCDRQIDLYDFFECAKQNFS